MKPDKAQFTGDGHKASKILYAAPGIGEKILHQLPDTFTRQQFMAVVCSKGLSYKYGWNLLMDLIRSQATVCTAPDEFKINDNK